MILVFFVRKKRFDFILILTKYIFLKSYLVVILEYF